MNSNEFERLDIFLSNLTGYSRGFCQELIISGNVLVDSRIIEKPGKKIFSQSKVEYKIPSTKYVSRGGNKLEKAIDEFNINLKNKICLDAGASTGGFTDCMLQKGALKVIAVDSGTNQLSEYLINEPKVISLEKTNIRHLLPEAIGGPADFATADLSFISLEKVMGKLFELTKNTGECVFLIKPQFEAGREHVNKKGIVKDFKIHMRVISKIYQSALSTGFKPVDITRSPIKGAEGNTEYLIYLKKYGEISPECKLLEKAVVK